LPVAQDQADFVFVQPATIVDEDFWPNTLAFASPGTQVGAQPCTQLWSDTDFTFTSPAVSEDYWPDPLPPPQSVPATGPGTQPCSDVDFVSVPAPILDEDYWPLFSSVRQWLGMQPAVASWLLWIGDGEAIAGSMPEKIPGPYWIRREGQSQGLFGRKRWR
jgi:hypothetical protein